MKSTYHIWLQILTIIIPVIFCISCNKSTDAEDTNVPILFEIDFSENLDAKISTLVDTLNFIPLIGSIEDPIAHVDELQIKDDKFFVLDKRRSIIYVYGKDGSKLYKIANLGKAENEYIEIACFAITDSTILIADNYGAKIIEYDVLTGNFKKSNEAPVVIDGIRPLNNYSFILAELPIEGANILESSINKRFYITDDHFKITKSSYPMGNVRDKYAMPSYLTGNDSSYVYASAGFNGYTLINASDGSIKGNVLINTENPLKYEEIADMPIQEAPEHIAAKNWQILTTTPRICGKYVLLHIKDGNSASPAIYDIENNQLYFNDYDDYHNLLISPHASDGNTFFTVYNFGEGFLDAQLEKGFNRPPNAADSIIRNNGTVILGYQMKQI